MTARCAARHALTDRELGQAAIAEFLAQRRRRKPSAISAGGSIHHRGFEFLDPRNNANRIDGTGELCDCARDDQRTAQERITTSASMMAKEGRPMPAWVEVLLNVIGYGGFIAIAMYHRSSSEKLPEQDPR